MVKSFLFFSSTFFSTPSLSNPQIQHPRTPRSNAGQVQDRVLYARKIGYSSASLLDLDTAVGFFVGGSVAVVAAAAALETLHLPCLELAEVLLAHVDAADLVSHDVRLDVLLCPGL